jgi:TldD protein
MSELLAPLLKALRSRSAAGLDHIELRADDVVQTSIELRESLVEGVTRKLERGHSARVLRAGRWGFASSDGMDDVATTIAEASAAARALSKGGPIDTRMSDVRPVRRKVRPPVAVPLAEVALEDKVSHLASMCRSVVGADPRIASAKASYMDITGERALVTSEGTEVSNTISHAYLMAHASGKESGRMVSVRDEVGTVSAGWEFFSRVETAEATSARLVRKARLQMDGVPCRRGTHPCVISPRVAGMLAHEALGHLSEADLFAAGAFNGLAGRRIAPESVTMVDSPRVDGGFGNIVVDDEGVVPKPVTLIDGGILGSQMTNREWAARLGVAPTGNARAENYRVPPVIRMRNTYFERGDMTLEELLEGTKSGYYCVDVRGGQAESNSSFQVGIQECYEVVRGELGRSVRSLAISGLATKSLRMIDGVGKDFGLESSYCGKFSQSMPTSDGGPHIGIRKGGIVFGGAD